MKLTLQLLVASLLVLLVPLSSRAQVDIVTESFETDGSGGARYTLGVAHSNDGGSEDYWERGTDANFSSYGMDIGALGGENGSNYLGTENGNNLTGGGETVVPGGRAVVDLNTVTITGYTAVEVRMLLATGGLAKFDRGGGDGIFIEISVDGGGYTTLAAFEGTGTFNTNLFEDTDLDGTGDGTQLTSNFQEFTWAIGTTGTTLDLRVTMQSTAGDEEIFLDYMRVRGTIAGPMATPGVITDPFCVSPSAGAAVTIPFTTTGSFNGGNTYTAQLSNASGSFASPTVIGTLAGNAATGNINATIPAGSASGTGYRIRIVTDDPVGTGPDNGTDLEVVLGASNVSGESTTPASTQVTVSWTLPADCYDEVLIVARQAASVSVSPSGDGTAYTANSAFGSGTDLGTSQYAVYKGTSTSDVVTGLTDGVNYCFKIFTRNGTDWSTGTEVCATPNTSTIFDKGDFALVAVNSNRSGCGGASGDDEISFVCFKDILPGDEFHFTDNGYERTTANLWGSTEGVVRITRTTSTITAGTVVTMAITSAGVVSFISPDANWTSVKEFGNFNLNNGGDQVWFMQGGTWTNTATHQASYSGNILFGFSTNGTWTSFASNTTNSGLFPTMNCFSMAPTGATDFNKYTGPVTAANQRTWLLRFSDNTNWNSPANCTAYDALAPNYVGGYSIVITPGGFTNGTWNGATDTDWFDCSNWQDLDVPTIASDVLIPSSGVTNEPTVGAAGAIASSVTIESGRTLTINNAASTLQVDGNFNNSGTVTHSAGVVSITGPASSINGNAIRFTNLTVAKDLNANITLNTDITVTNTALFTQGYITSTAANNFIFANGSAASSASDGSHIIGPVNKFGATDFTFPLGDGTYYRPAAVTSITSGGATSEFQAEYYNYTADTDGYNRASKAGTIDHLSNCEYWTVDEVGTGSPGATVMLSWDDPASCGVTILADLRVAWWNGFQWRDQGNASTSGTTGSGTITAGTANTSFSPFTLSSTIAAPDNPLPVELLTFDARFNGSEVDLGWITGTEINSDYFIVERSANGREFVELGMVSAAGNSFEPLSYRLSDQTPLSGTSYYRLKQVDLDGSWVHSKVVPVQVQEISKELAIDYVISNDQLVQAVLTNSASQVQTVEVFNMVGKLVFRQQLAGAQGNAITIPAHYFTSGVYMMRVSDGQHAAVKKFAF